MCTLENHNITLKYLVLGILCSRQSEETFTFSFGPLSVIAVIMSSFSPRWHRIWKWMLPRSIFCFCFVLIFSCIETDIHRIHRFPYFHPPTGFKLSCQSWSSSLPEVEFTICSQHVKTPTTGFPNIKARFSKPKLKFIQSYHSFRWTGRHNPEWANAETRDKYLMFVFGSNTNKQHMCVFI